MSVSDLNEDTDVSVTRDRLGLSSHVNGMATSTVPKNFPHSVLVTSTGQPLFLRQPLMQGDRTSMVPITSPFLTQASVFYSPHFLGPQQLAAAHQFTQVSPLIPLRSNVSLTRENCASAAAHNGCIVNKVSVFKTDDAPSSCSKSGCAAPGLMYDSSVVINEVQDGRDLAAVGATSTATSPSGSSGTPKSPLTPGTPQPTVPSPVVDEICVICSDKATGHHYGVTSCEGCKGFFKRSVQNRKTYSCRNLTQDCPVDKRHRNRCQFCRFQKCVKAGMLKEAVREDRTPGGKHKNRPLSLQSRTKPEPAKQARTHSSSSSSLGSEGDLQQSTTHSTMPSRTFPPFITELLRHEPCDSEYSDECPGCQVEDTGQKTLAHVTQLAEVQVRKNQEWFKSLPLLVNINDSDKKILIRSAWLELMLINLTKHSLHFDNKVHLCKGQVLDVSTALATGIGDILNRVMQLTAKFKELNLDGAEFVCIKVIVLLNPDVKGLYEQPLIERLQDKVHASLLEYNNTFHPGEPNRFGNILLRLPELRSIGTKCLERLFMLSFTGQIHTSNSLSELLHSTRR